MRLGFCRHDFLRESTAEAFALVRPTKIDRRSKGPRHLDWDRFSGDARTAPTRKNYLSPGNSLQSHMRIDSHFLASASDAPMPTTRCPKSARRKRLASQLADHTETVENRHLQIQEHNIGRISMDEVTPVHGARFQPKSCRQSTQQRHIEGFSSHPLFSAGSSSALHAIGRACRV